MNDTSTLTSVRKHIVVACSRERAFEVFTSRMGLWWPSEHHIGKSPMVDAVVEPRVGGRWYEVCEDGSECTWGRVVAWEPPARLLLAWQLNGAFVYDPAFETEVEVVFTVLASGETRVDLEHRHLERFGARAEAMREAFASRDGWQLGLDLFAEAALHGVKPAR